MLQSYIPFCYHTQLSLVCTWVITMPEACCFAQNLYVMRAAQAREVHSKELKGSISAIASLQGHLLIAIGPKIILHTWNGSELNGAAFFDAPLYVVSLNIVSSMLLLTRTSCQTWAVMKPALKLDSGRVQLMFRFLDFLSSQYAYSSLSGSICKTTARELQWLK